MSLSMSTSPVAGRLLHRRALRSLGRPVLRALLLAALLLPLASTLTSARADEAPPLDLNRATAAELEALPGIGAVKAAAIVAHRQASGGFASVDELEGVHGIGPALAAELRSLVTVGRPARSSAGAGSGPASK